MKNGLFLIPEERVFNDDNTSIGGLAKLNKSEGTFSISFNNQKLRGEISIENEVLVFESDDLTTLHRFRKKSSTPQ